MRIVIDSREQQPLPLTCETERATLPVADYGIAGGFSDWSNPAFVVERKSLDDLVGSLTQGRQRFMREIEKMRQFRFRALVIEGEQVDVERGNYRSKASPQSILQSLAALQVRAGLHVLWCGTPEGAARAVERLARQFCRGVEKDYRRLQDASDSTISERMAQ